MTSGRAQEAHVKTRSRAVVAFAAVLFAVLPHTPAAAQTLVGSEFRVNTATTGFQLGPAVSVTPSCDFLVTWTGPDGSLGGVFAQLYAAGGTALGSEFQVNTYTTSYQSVPRVGSDGTGNFAVVWESVSQDGHSSGIFGQRLSA